MPRATLKTCRNCGRHADEVGLLSHTRLCGECGPALLAEAVTQQVQHEGPVFQRWRARIAASVGAELPGSEREAV